MSNLKKVEYFRAVMLNLKKEVYIVDNLKKVELNLKKVKMSKD